MSEVKSCLEIHYDRSLIPGYAWVFPLGKDRANVGAGVFHRYPGRDNAAMLYRAFLAHSPMIGDRLDRARMEDGTLRAWPIAMGTSPHPRGIGNAVLVGDAGSMTDPVTGEGIYGALRSGELAAIALHQLQDGKAKEHTFGRIYERLWRREFRWHEFLPGSFYMALLRSRAFVNAAVARASKNPNRASVLAGTIAHLLPMRKLFFSIGRHRP